MDATNHAEAPLNPGLVFEMLQAHQRTAALKAAIDLDLFRAIGEGPGDVASIARQCSASERGIRNSCAISSPFTACWQSRTGATVTRPPARRFLTPARLRPWPHRAIPL